MGVVGTGDATSWKSGRLRVLLKIQSDRSRDVSTEKKVSLFLAEDEMLKFTYLSPLDVSLQDEHSEE